MCRMQVPDPAPLASFGGQPMTHELAEDLFIGWLVRRLFARPNAGATKSECWHALVHYCSAPPTSACKSVPIGCHAPTVWLPATVCLQDADSTTSLDRPSALQPFSWRVFAGKNAAYDFFNCQYQLFYRGKGKGGMWYDPSFKVSCTCRAVFSVQRRIGVKRAQLAGSGSSWLGFVATGPTGPLRALVRRRLPEAACCPTLAALHCLAHCRLRRWMDGPCGAVAITA